MKRQQRLGPMLAAFAGSLLLAPCAAPGAATESPQLDLVAHLSLPGPNGNLWVHKQVLYVGSDAPGGVKLIDIADPARPTLITSLPGRPNTGYFTPKVISVNTPAFQGDLLAVGLLGATRGVEFWNVTDPRQPQLLSFMKLSGLTNGVADVALFQRGERVLLLLTTWESGVRIVEATDPAQPVLLAKWRFETELGIKPSLGFTSNLTDFGVSASADGTRAYVAYRDGGAVILDITDPAKPRFLGRTIYALTEEGETSTAVEADEGRLLITTDFGAHEPQPRLRTNVLRVTAPARLAGLYPAVELAVTRQLTKTGPVHGEVAYIGSSLAGTELLADPQGKIALLDPGTKEQWAEQVLRAQAAGAIAVLFSKTTPRSSLPDARITIPGTGLTPEAGETIKSALVAGEKVGVELFVSPATWGFTRIWDIRDPAKPVQVGTYATPNSLVYPNPNPGQFGVSNVRVHGNHLYLPYGSDGVRVVDIANPAQPQEIGQYVLNEAAAIWDVVVHEGLVLARDDKGGLWIFRDAP